MYDMTLLENDSYDIQRIDINIIEQLLQSGKKDSCREVINAFYDSINYDYLKSLMLRLYINMDIYIAAKTFAGKIGISNDDFIDRFGSIDDIEKRIVTKSAIIDYFSDMLEQCVAWRIEFSRDESKIIINKAKEYLAANFQKDDTSLKSVADAINLSATYFSYLFKKEVGKNFVEYLSLLRIEKAKELLCCTSMQVTEIAYKVGFNDYRYFSQIFKKYSGLTPREFQMNNNK